MRDYQTVLSELNAMPVVADIVATLTAAGIKAYPGNYSRCALAMYIQQETGTEVGVSDDMVEVLWTANLPLRDIPKYTPLSPTAGAFVNRFDELTFPELITEDYTRYDSLPYSEEDI